MERYFEKISFEQFKTDIKDDRVLYDRYELPIRKTKASAGYDFLAIQDFEIEPGQIKKIPTGIKAKYPKDEMLMLFVRSSMGFKWNVRMCNQVGIIDADFYNNPENEGHIWIALQNEGNKTFKVKAKEGFCQGVFVKYNCVSNEEKIENERLGWSGKPERGKNENE